MIPIPEYGQSNAKFASQGGVTPKLVSSQIRFFQPTSPVLYDQSQLDYM